MIGRMRYNPSCQIGPAIHQAGKNANLTFCDSLMLKDPRLFKRLFYQLPLPMRHKIKKMIYRLPFSSGKGSQRGADVYVVSYPKCGRTWLRLMIGQVFALYVNEAEANPLQPDEIARNHPGLPLIQFTHDDYPHLKTSAELSKTKQNYKGKKVIFLARDPRDVVVSYYFEVTRRASLNPNYPIIRLDLSAFLRYSVGSIDTIIHYYNIWAENRHLPGGFLLLRYEDLQAETERELRRVLDFIGLVNLPQELIHQAVKYTRFENMRRLEESGALDSFRLRPGDRYDPESFKTRRGKVGGFVDYLSQDDIAYLNHKIKTQLSPLFGYQP